MSSFYFSIFFAFYKFFARLIDELHSWEYFNFLEKFID